MSTTAIRNLASLELFAGCRRAELARIDQLGCTLTLPPGRVLCTEGARGNEFFVMLEGDAEVRTPHRAVARLHRGAWFGEVALLKGEPRRATVTTMTDVTLLVFGLREFQALLHLAPCVRARLEGTTARLASGDIPTRSAWYQPLATSLGRA